MMWGECLDSVDISLPCFPTCRCHITRTGWRLERFSQDGDVLASVPPSTVCILVTALLAARSSFVFCVQRFRNSIALYLGLWCLWDLVVILGGYLVVVGLHIVNMSVALLPVTGDLTDWPH